MPAYHFHLAFELYQRTVQNQACFVLDPDQDIFAPDLPYNKASSWASYLAPRRRRSASSDLRRRRTTDQRPEVRRAGSDFAQSKETTAGDARPAQDPPEAKHELSRSVGDWRLDAVAIESIDMELGNIRGGGGGGATTASAGGGGGGAAAATTDSAIDQHMAASGLALRGRYVPSNARTTNVGWGVVHLYRDSDPLAQAAGDDRSATREAQAFVDKDCTTLCILAVPSYMTPSDLLGWIGEDKADQVSHFRLVRSDRANKYMVLMKFREAAQARDWHKEWNGKPFNSMEPENCHVVFIKSIQFQYPDEQKDPSSFPDRTNDPFIPASKQTHPLNKPPGETRSATPLTAKPVPPPTPALVELPTCPVCLERMDDTTGLATIFCQHVFHCACLQKWKNSGCPVCRYTQTEPASRAKGKGEEPTECVGCGSRENLWICLICGNVGCGRYDEAHAFAHYERTGHMFAMDIGTQHIWDYAADEYVHRLIRNKSDGKILDLPSERGYAGVHNGEYVPRDKLSNVTEEYTYLITSQLESQRQYYEEQLDRAVDKAATAAASADKATDAATQAVARLEALQLSHEVMRSQTIPGLERDKDKLEKRADKFETMARKMEKEWREKEVINDSLMHRISHLEKQLHDALLKSSDLEEQNRDLTFFISGTEKLKGADDDVQQGTVSVAEAPAQTGKKKRRPPAKKGPDG